MDNENNEKSWFSDLSWKTALIVAGLSTLFGGGAGGALVATKAVQAQGLNQDQADVRYLTKDEAGRWRDVRDRQFDAMDKKMVTDRVFDERTNMILKQIELLREERRLDREYFERVLLNQNR